MKAELILGLAISAAATLAVVGAHEIGWHRATKQAQAQSSAHEEAMRANHAEELGQANQRERSLEGQAVTALNTQASALQKEIDRVTNERNAYAARVRSGAVRLSVPVAAPPSDHRANPGGPATPAAPAGDEARAELAPEAGLALTAIADDGDDAIKQLNCLVDAYATLRDLFNAGTANDAQAALPACAD